MYKYMAYCEISNIWMPDRRLEVSGHLNGLMLANSSKFVVFRNPAANAELVLTLRFTLHIYHAILFMLISNFCSNAVKTASLLSRTR